MIYLDEREKYLRAYVETVTNEAADVIFKAAHETGMPPAVLYLACLHMTNALICLAKPEVRWRLARGLLRTAEALMQESEAQHPKDAQSVIDLGEAWPEGEPS